MEGVTGIAFGAGTFSANGHAVEVVDVTLSGVVVDKAAGLAEVAGSILLQQTAIVHLAAAVGEILKGGLAHVAVESLLVDGAVGNG